MCRVLQAGLRSLKLGGHPLENGSALEVERNIRRHVVEQRVQRIVRRQSRTDRRGGLIRPGAKDFSLQNLCQARLSVLGKQRSASQEQLVVKVVIVVSIQDVIAVEQALQ